MEINVMFGKKMKKQAALEAVCIDAPLSSTFLTEYRTWFHKTHLTVKEKQAITAVAMDGHEKTSARCLGTPPAHAGRPRKDASQKSRYNGWFMLMDTCSGIILGVVEMKEPENNNHVIAVLRESLPNLPKANCVIYDRACRCLKTLQSTKDFKQIKTWAVDKFHAQGHAKNCPCSHLHVPRVAKRQRKVNTSVCEQVFAWFRGYSLIFNNMEPNKHRF